MKTKDYVFVDRAISESRRLNRVVAVDVSQEYSLRDVTDYIETMYPDAEWRNGVETGSGVVTDIWAGQSPDDFRLHLRPTRA